MSSNKSSGNDREWCSYCGYPDDYHPVEYADPNKDGILCEELAR